MSQRRLILAGPLLLACVAGGMSAGGGRATPATEGRCPGVSVDTRGWQLTRSFELGVEVLHPPSYERKMWTSRSPGYPSSLDLWRRDGKPAWVVQLKLLSVDSMFPLSPFAHARTLRCTMRTRSGDVPALLARVAKTRLPAERDSFYLVYFRLPRSDGRTVISFDGSSADSAGYVEQIAIAQSLRLRELGAPSGNEP
jgi:hypothetical protein